MKNLIDTSVTNAKGKSVNQLWTELTAAIHTGISQYVPGKTVSTKMSLPWITQEISVLLEKETAYIRSTRFQVRREIGLPS